VAFQAGICGQADGMAVIAGCPFMVDAVPFAAIATRMRQVKKSGAPCTRAVALVAGHSREQAGVIGWVGVTGNARCGNYRKDGIGVAFCASQPRVCTGQREFGQRMVEGGGQPALGGVTGAASISELAFVGIILCMAASAVLGGRFKVCNTPSPCMTAPTIKGSMFPGQLERDICVVEGVPVAVNPIVTSQAVISIFQQVRLHEIRFDLLVAGSADSLVEPGIAVHMAGFANKRRAIRLFLVGSESIPECIVGNIDHGQVG